MTLPFSSMSFWLACVIIVLGASSPATAFIEVDVDVPSGYTHFPDVNVSYKVHTEMHTWAEAREACIAEGAHLAIIDTMAKVRYVAQLKEFNVYVWIGISRTDSGTPWLTAENRVVMSNLPWAPGKPYGSHNCLAVRGCNRGLTNENCSDLLGFVCEIQDIDPQGDSIIELF